MHAQRIGLDNSIFIGRLKINNQHLHYQRREPYIRPRVIDDFVKPNHGAVSKAPVPPPVVPLATPSTKTRPTSSTKKKRVHKKSLLLSSAAMLLLIVGSYVSFLGFKSNNDVKAQVQALTTGNTQNPDADDGIPDETDPGAAGVGSYQVAAHLPRVLTIEKINVNARVKRLGVDTQNALKAPSNIFDTGWYESSAAPGEAGAMLIDGHVSGPTKPGVFKNLKKLQNGDVINIERGDGRVFSYEVVNTKVYDADKVDMAAALVSAESGKQGLNLITCTGAFNASSNDYQQRLIVFAVQK